MDSISNENQLTIVKDYDFKKPDSRFYLTLFLKTVEINNFILSNKDLFMIFNLQIFLFLRKSISQLLMDLLLLKVNNMV